MNRKLFGRFLLLLIGLLLGVASTSASSLALDSFQGLDLDAHAVMGHNPTYGAVTDPRPAIHSASPKIWGYDVSSWQGTIDFSQLSTAASFVVIRADYGTGNPDSKFAANRAAAEAEGMEIGFYHYAYPEYNTAVDEANSFANIVGHLNPGQFVVLDFEENWNGDVVGWCKTWLDTVKSRLGVKPLIYINLSTVKKYDWSPVYGADYGLWLAYWDFDKNADPPANAWPFTAMRQYSDHETAPGISGNVDGDVFYGSLDQLKKYGYPGTAATVSWANPPAQNRWYRTSQTLMASASGTQPITLNEIVDGSIVKTLTGSSATIDLSTLTPGMHKVSVTASNPYNSSPASTGDWTGGWDPNPPTAARTGGAAPSTWYSTDQTVQFSCSDALSGFKRFRYKWDDGAYSDWSTTSTGSASLQQGQHHLFIQVEDNAWDGTSQSGNTAVIDLGEYWLDKNPAEVKISAQLVSALAGTVQVQITVSNPNLSPVSNVKFSLIQLGPANAAEGGWTISSIDGSKSVSKTFTFPISFGTNKALLLTANYEVGTGTYRLRWRIPSH